jgi:hypothetical protein
MLALHKSIQSSDRSSLITDFRLYLQNWQIHCEYSIIETEIRRRHQCHCDEYDDIFRNILSSLHSLRLLHFYCSLCQNPLKHRHGYLPRLDFPYLVAFQFICYCSFGPSRSSEIARTAPYMTTVTTLSLDWSSNWAISVYPGEPMVIEEGMLPNVTAMIHNGTVYADNLVVARPISRICRLASPRGYPYTLHHAVEVSPGRLTHLYSSDLLDGLAEFLLESPQPYRHLTSIGTLLFKSYKACVNCSM